MLAVIGLWLLAPWIDRLLGEAGAVQIPARSSWRGLRGGLAAALLMVVAIAATSITRDPFDVAGSLPDAAVAPVAAQGRADAAGAAGDDWPAYGGTGQGQRYSSLNDITPDTVHRLGLAWTFHTGEPGRCQLS